MDYEREITSDLINLRALTDICHYSDRRSDCIYTLESFLNTMNKFYAEQKQLKKDIWRLVWREEIKDLVETVYSKTYGYK